MTNLLDNILCGYMKLSANHNRIKLNVHGQPMPASLIAKRRSVFVLMNGRIGGLPQKRPIGAD
jgi:hypothetical protein